MSDMKCPFCQQELKHEKTTGIYCCPRTFIDCPLGLGTGAFGTKELWQELIRTRKALDVAKDTFNWIDETYRTGQEMEAEIWGKVQLATQQITALEQKD